MIRVIILDVSGTYCQIFDEFYCDEEDYDKKINTYSSDNFFFIKLSY